MRKFLTALISTLALLWCAPTVAQQTNIQGGGAAGCTVAGTTTQIVTNSGSAGCTSSTALATAGGQIDASPTGSTSPAYSWIGHLTNGLFYDGTSSYGFDTSAAAVFCVCGGGPAVVTPSTWGYGWASSTGAYASIDTGLFRLSAGNVEVSNSSTANSSGGLKLGTLTLTNLTFSATAATISAAGGLGSAPSITTNGSAAMDITAGSSTSAATFTIGLPTATNGWVCNGSDITTKTAAVSQLVQTGGSVSTAVMALYSDVSVLAAPVAADHIRISCTAY